MVSEAVHSFVDGANEALLLYAIAQANRVPDDTHPLGDEREIYFCSFVVEEVVALFVKSRRRGSFDLKRARRN